jgi:hypothetical protein
MMPVFPPNRHCRHHCQTARTKPTSCLESSFRSTSTIPVHGSSVILWARPQGVLNALFHFA